MNTTIESFKNKLKLADAEAFCRALDSAPDARYVFQTFHDVDKRKREFVKQFYGTFNECKEELIKLNFKGAGIFVTINRSSNGGRTADDIDRVRAVFADDDEGNMPPLKIQPSILVQSKKGMHVYWRINDGEKLHEFLPTQNALIHHLGTDQSIKDLPRVMRIPGFLHQKNPMDPYLVKLLGINNLSYTFSEVQSGYPILEQTKEDTDSNYDDIDTPLFFKENGFFVGNKSDDIILIKCFWNDNHTSGSPGDSSSVLIRRDNGTWKYDCKHSHCTGKTLQHFFDQFPESTLERYRTGKNIIKKLTPAKLYAKLAKQFLEKKYPGYNGSGGLRLFRDDYYIFNGTHYVQKCSKKEIKHEVTAFLQHLNNPLTSSGYNNVIANLEGLTFLNADNQFGCWLNNPHKSGNFVCLKNGILDLAPLKLGKPLEILPHDPNFFSTVCLPFSYNPESMSPVFEKFISEVIPHPETRAFLQEWFGYNLIYDVGQAKFVILVGEGANGKSVLCTVLRALIGENNVSAVGLEAFNPQRTFPLAATDGKLSNIVEELNEISKPVEGLLKQFVAGGAMTVERKNRDPFTMIPTARITFATNILPHFSDRSQGLWRRMIVIPMHVQVLDENKQNKNFTDSIWWINSGELPGIFNWALAGLSKLLNRGHFLEPEESKVEKASYRNEVNPAKVFLREYCKEAPEVETSSSQIYSTYKSYMSNEGLLPLGAPQFAKEVRRVYPKAFLSANARRFGVDRTRVWTGIKLIDEGVIHPHDKM